MDKFGAGTNIKNLKIGNFSHGSSLNFGPSIHKGLQANQKFTTGELVIGDEFTFGCPDEEEEEE